MISDPWRVRTAGMLALWLMAGHWAMAQGSVPRPAVVFPAQAATALVASPAAADQAGWAAAGTPSAGPTDPTAAGYRLGAGDLVRIVVYQNPDLTLEARLTEAGMIRYPLLGPIRLGGLDIASAERLIAEALQRGSFVRQPQVTLSVQQVRAHQASVLGGVNRPGRYPIEATDLRLSDLLAMAGGTVPGSSDVVVVTGAREGKAFRFEVALPQLFAPDGARYDLLMRDGDTVWIDRQPLVYIYGEVQRPGVLRLERGMTLMQALAAGGGPNPRGTDKGILVHRRGEDGRVRVLQPRMDEPVRDGDVVFVRESLF
ncbi:MAG: polysaccharide export protein EpsE [Rubrivivax sp.]